MTVRETAVSADPPVVVDGRRWWRRHRILTGLLAVVTALLLIALPSLVPALTAPGTDSLSAKFAEWARTHGLASIANLAERIQYDLNPPKVGGRPAHGLPKVRGAVPVRVARIPGELPLPAAVRPFANPPLAGEGRWHVVDTVHGVPALAVTYMRPDPVHTSYVGGLVWMNPNVLTFALHPGYEDPGSGNWGQPDTLPASHRTGLLAAFNSGFRLYASNGGWYAYGHTADALRNGAASFVIFRNGSATVGMWGRDVRMGSNVVAVRQNLDLIVDGGRPVPGLDQNVEQKWGATLGNAFYVWRSAVGVTANGALIYASGPALSVSSLARLMARAGCVRAMELDINPEWTSFVLYHAGAAPAAPTAQNLLPAMQQPPDRYFYPVSRDFFSVYARGSSS